jgi:hypothetical protein
MSEDLSPWELADDIRRFGRTYHDLLTFEDGAALPDMHIDPARRREYIASFKEPSVRQIIEFVMDHIRYIPFATLYRALMDDVRVANDGVCADTYVVLMLTGVREMRSTAWVTLLLAPFLRFDCVFDADAGNERSKRDRAKEIVRHVRSQEATKNTPITVLLCDDCSYTGHQLRDTLDSMNDTWGFEEGGWSHGAGVSIRVLIPYIGLPSLIAAYALDDRLKSAITARSASIVSLRNVLNKFDEEHAANPYPLYQTYVWHGDRLMSLYKLVTRAAPVSQTLTYFQTRVPSGFPEYLVAGVPPISSADSPPRTFNLLAGCKTSDEPPVCPSRAYAALLPVLREHARAFPALHALFSEDARRGQELIMGLHSSPWSNASKIPLSHRESDLMNLYHFLGDPKRAPPQKYELDDLADDWEEPVGRATLRRRAANNPYLAQRITELIPAAADVLAGPPSEEWPSSQLGGTKRGRRRPRLSRARLSRARRGRGAASPRLRQAPAARR